MRRIFAALLLTTLVTPAVFGQANSAPPPRPLPASAFAGNPPPPKSADSRNFFQRLFGTRPKPTPVPTPAPVVRRTPRLKPRPAPEIPDEPVRKNASKVAPPIPTEPAPAAKPKIGKGAKKGAAATVIGDAADDPAKFKMARAKALEDAHIKDLKSKADGEVNEAEANKALTNYNRALFQKIREVDPSVSDYAGKVEQSMNKRIGNERGRE